MGSTFFRPRVKLAADGQISTLVDIWTSIDITLSILDYSPDKLGHKLISQK